uniref:Uncharacterized protein n=1 Tax=Aegilops tauschii subsp. strangulata TaxID=200361 RepID=A0A453G5D7_AEGTS
MSTNIVSFPLPSLHCLFNFYREAWNMLGPCCS